MAYPKNGMAELARTASLRPRFETGIIVIRVVTCFSTHSLDSLSVCLKTISGNTT